MPTGWEAESVVGCTALVEVRGCLALIPIRTAAHKALIPILLPDSVAMSSVVPTRWHTWPWAISSVVECLALVEVRECLALIPIQLIDFRTQHHEIYIMWIFHLPQVMIAPTRHPAQLQLVVQLVVELVVAL